MRSPKRPEYSKGLDIFQEIRKHNIALNVSCGPIRLYRYEPMTQQACKHTQSGLQWLCSIKLPPLMFVWVSRTHSVIRDNTVGQRAMFNRQTV